MDRLKRKPLEGLANIVRFNWPFYAAAGSVLVAGSISLPWLPMAAQVAGFVLLSAGALLVLVSLLVSWYVYDVSGFYRLNWLPAPTPLFPESIVNIHAGFDESSALLSGRYPQAMLCVLDFYDERRHTEPSIRRARRVRPPYPGTISTDTVELPLLPGSQVLLCNILAAHEIRDPAEQVAFFRAQALALRPDGYILVAEHLRDWPNLLAYNLGAFHFHARRRWLDTFRESGLRVICEEKHTPFITIFLLRP